ncbi:hypothetical protein FK220_019410 [Flavobacteriaceae bacterium TP-CH-4]|uniref:Long-chain fatty acid transport protein n=1 Tax=Pelagihabitans pacificus TaxID=2696054 RepID=A0A967E8C5_9FLAO|nr:hypothetical protein [Pelagihabitans pacificus]NHF61530.1 hypothetical protein [Pelagihabitans pacificus]
MVKNLIIAVVCLTATGLYAQDGTVSPYSYFGIGDARSFGTVENQMMGSIGVYGDSIHINLQNPAAYSRLGVALNNRAGLANYAAGVSNKQVQLKSFTEEQSTSTTNLDYLSLGFSLGKGFGIGFGIAPFTSVGYNLVSESVNSDNAQVVNEFTGEGGLNRVYFSAGYALWKDLSIGVTANFNFGNLESRRIQTVENVQFGTRDLRTSKVNGLDFNYALYYTPKITEKHTLFVSTRVNTQANLTSKNTRQIGSFLVSAEQPIETIDVNLDTVGQRNTDLKIPTTATLGLGYGEERKWFLGAEYSFQGLSSFSNEFLEDDNLVYEDASTFSFGGFFIPDYDAFSGYYKRIVYRAGIRYDRTGMLVNNREINNFGITFGVGLPLGRELSNLNLGFELGRRGTTSADLIEESYLKINLGFSFNDLWFRKRKIN